jgi:nucleoid-associated protein YgaU
MNDPAVKVGLAISVLVGGVFIAIVFRPVFSSPPGPNTQINTPLNLQPQSRLPVAAAPEKQNSIATLSSKLRLEDSSITSQNATVLLPLGDQQAAPNLPERYPVAASTNNARWGTPLNMMPVVARSADGPTVHKILDGDKLEDLAARYLGSPDKAMEIFDANRQVLSNPNILPIGVELKIPFPKK